MINLTEDIITPETAKTLSGLFDERVRRTPYSAAYKYFDEKTSSWEVCSWSEMAFEISRWRTAMSREHLRPGDRVAIWICNCKEWVMMDQAALGLGLVVVPLFCTDRPENVAYILKDAGVKLLLIDNEDYWLSLDSLPDKPGCLERIVSMSRFKDYVSKDTVRFVGEWLPDKGNEIDLPSVKPDDLATIVYTSGTTGQPKGVKLSHHNILWNSFGGLNRVTVYREDIFLSFLPLSHTFERTVGYYIPLMAGAAVAYNRSIHKLAEDFKAVNPTLLVSVPRIFERVYAKIMAELEERHAVIRRLFDWAVELGWKRFEYIQGREKWGLSFLLWPLPDMLVAKKIREGFGGRIRAMVVGGAPLSINVAKVFLAAGLPLLQGYGMTESGPVISVNMINDNIPSSVGPPYEGSEVRIGKDDELLVRSPGVMLGYLNNPEATAEVINSEGWLHTGDKARIEKGHIFITGRIKEIIVMANGEKVPPLDIEMAIDMDPLIDQVMIVGEGKPYLSALIVLNKEKGHDIASKFGLKPDNPGFLKDKRIEQFIIDRIASRLHSFPGYAKVRRAALISEPWTIENELITPTLKLRRKRIIELYGMEIHELYKGHEVGTE